MSSARPPSSSRAVAIAVSGPEARFPELVASSARSPRGRGSQTHTRCTGGSKGCVEYEDFGGDVGLDVVAADARDDGMAGQSLDGCAGVGLHRFVE